MGIRVFVLDDHEMVRRGVRVLVDLEDDMELVGEASTVRHALSVVEDLQPDVAVVDVRLPDGDGVGVCREIRRRDLSTRCLVWTAHTDDEVRSRAVAAGAAGYVRKDLTPERFSGAVRRVAAGDQVYEAAATARTVAPTSAMARTERQLQSLTDREWRVLELIAEGLSNRQIGEELSLAEKTVKNYVSNLLAKLGLERRTQAAVLLARLRIDGH